MLLTDFKAELPPIGRALRESSRIRGRGNWYQYVVGSNNYWAAMNSNSNGVFEVVFDRQITLRRRIPVVTFPPGQ